MFLWLAIGLGVLCLALWTAQRIVFPVFDFPAPAGSFAIGTVTYHWVDTTRREAFVSDSPGRRELMVQVWYPAETDESAPRTTYVDDPSLLLPLAHLLHLPGFVFRHLKRIHTNAVEAAPVAAGQPAFPLIICSHGRGGYRQEDTWLVEELVSQGYIVAAIDHPYAASGVRFPDGRRVMYDARMNERGFVDSKISFLAQDVSFTLNQLESINRSDTHDLLTGHVDTGHTAVLGLSLGGMVGVQAAVCDERIKACLVMDVRVPEEVLRDGLRQPAMFITRDPETMRLEGWAEADVGETLTTMRAAFHTLPGTGYFVQAEGMFHQDFSDAPLLSPLASTLGLTGPIGYKRAHEITTGYSLAFFDSELKGRSEPLLKGASPRYPEVQVETRAHPGSA